jgi:hypothetical protein
VLLAVTVFASAGVLAVLAWRNVKLGRGDRRGALRLALAVLVLETIFVVFNRHWTFQPLSMVRVLIYLLGLPLFAAIQTWAYYVGVEPFVRRRWPHLLIAWTRLLDGRWRDPLVGRSVLVGTAAALVAFGIVPGILSLLARMSSLPVAAPLFDDGSLDYGVGWFLCAANSGWAGPVHTLLLISVLLIARLALRHDRPAWVVLLLVTFGIHAWDLLFRQPWWSGAPIALAIVTGVLAALLVAVLAREGLLAGASLYSVGIALWWTPLTYDVTRWYAWRTGVVVTLVAGLAFWGFRNLLGKQSAFPAGALDT